MELEKLKNTISEGTFEKLSAGKIESLSFILDISKNELRKLTGLSEAEADEVLLAASKLCLKHHFYTVDQLHSIKRLNTGCSSINAITKGGIAINGITEIVGCSGVGKTQFCLQLSIMCQLPTKFGGMDKKVIYICTEDVFPSKRFAELETEFKEKFSCPNLQFQDNIYLEHIADYEQLRRCLFIKIPNFLNKNNIGLIIIDSIASVFRSENINVSYSTRSRDLATLAAKLNKICSQYKICIVCVNQVTENIELGKTEPCLGLSWSNLVTYRFNINRFIQSHIREFEVIFAPDLPCKSCKFTIQKHGLVGVD